MAIQSKIVSISPEIAEEMLATNTRNRPVRDSHVVALAAALRRGEWMLNGDSIRIDSDGVILDGQHRLLACVRANVDFPTLLLTGLDPAVFSTIDLGAKRKVADVLAVRGAKNTKIVASVARLAIVWERTGTPYGLQAGEAPTAIEVMEYLDANPDLDKAAQWVASNGGMRKLLPQSMLGFCRYMFVRHDPENADAFFEILESGAGLERGSPILLLRDRLAQNRQSRERISHADVAALVFKTFSKYCERSESKTLRIRRAGSAPENVRSVFALKGKSRSK